jgi:Glutamate 5-kinase
MTTFDFELVGKIGSMALINKQDNDIDYNVFSRIGRELCPGMIWVSSGAAEVGRLDYMKRNNGQELQGDNEDKKTDYAAQGQPILMKNYRRFIPPMFHMRQLLVEHQHFNDPVKRDHIRRFLMRAPQQQAIPIVNYNDPVSSFENRRWEMRDLQLQGQDVVECVDNDETAAVISTLVHARYLVILTSTKGIYEDPNDPSTLVREISGANENEVVAGIRQYQECCHGASRAGANGARAKLEFSIKPIEAGTTVMIASAQYRLRDILDGTCECTRIGVR